MDRLKAQIDFLLTCDRLKSIVRKNYLHDGSREENSAEHSWFVALMALTLDEYASVGTDMVQVVRMLVVHDLVEIFAGDAYIETPEAQAIQTGKEIEAADRLFDLLPDDQNAEFRALWDEFEARQSPEARFARQLDAFAPALLTWAEGGHGREQWGHPSPSYRDMKRNALAGTPFADLFQRWMQREDGLESAGN